MSKPIPDAKLDAQRPKAKLDMPLSEVKRHPALLQILITLAKNERANRPETPGNVKPASRLPDPKAIGPGTKMAAANDNIED